VFDLTLWGAFSLSVILITSVELVRRTALREDDPFVGRVIALAFAAKLIAGAVRYYILTVVYGGSGDAFRYINAGTEIAEQLRAGELPEQMWTLGTPFMEFLTGVMFALTQPNVLIGYLVLTLLSFTGMLFFLRAFETALPEGHRRRYAVLVLLLPSMLYWPSGIGKEAWLIFALGTAAFGAAKLLRRQRWGYTLTFLGTAGVFVIRPHIAALFAISLAIAYVLRVRDPDTKRGAIAWLIGLVIVGAGTGFAIERFDELLPNVEAREGGIIGQILEATDERTAIGGSSFEAQPVSSPQTLALALITVPFRPFPWEAHNAQSLLASLEAMVLLLLLVLSLPRLWSLRYVAMRRPYIALVSAYTVGFGVAYSSIGNFGILVRQRAQLLPFMLVLLCLPTVAELMDRPLLGRTRTGPPLRGPNDRAPGTLAGAGAPVAGRPRAVRRGAHAPTLIEQPRAAGRPASPR
jgi:hypothetical protein